MLEKLNTKNCIIARQDGAIYNTPAHIPHIASCNISGSINVGVNGMPASFTFQESRMPNRISTMASVTFLIERFIYVSNPTTYMDEKEIIKEYLSGISIKNSD